MTVCLHVGRFQSFLPPKAINKLIVITHNIELVNTAYGLHTDQSDKLIRRPRQTERMIGVLESVQRAKKEASPVQIGAVSGELGY